MKRIWVFLAVVLLVGGAVIGVVLTRGLKASPNNLASAELFSMVITMGGKELTIGAPQVGFYGISFPVKNSGKAPIAIAELKLIAPYSQFFGGQGSPGAEGVRESVIQVRDLARREVRTLFAQPDITLGGMQQLILRVEAITIK